MVTRALTLSSAAGSIGLESDEFAALQGTPGFGMAPVQVQWFDGAGDGSVYRSTRYVRKTIPLRCLVRARNADELQDRISTLARVTSRRYAPATLRMDEGAEAWSVRVVRTGGGDPVMGEETDGSSFADLTLILEAGDPIWQRDRAQRRVITPKGLGRGLLGGPAEGSGGFGDVAFGEVAFGAAGFGDEPFGGGSEPGAPYPATYEAGYGEATPSTGPVGRSLTRLRLSSSQAMGDVLLESDGDADAVPVVTITGPGTALTTVSPDGERLTWSGNLLAGQRRVIDHHTGTITDDTGADRYDELGAAPRFWVIPAGLTTAFVNLEGATAQSSVTLEWRPRREVVI